MAAAIRNAGTRGGSGRARATLQNQSRSSDVAMPANSPSERVSRSKMRWRSSFRKVCLADIGGLRLSTSGAKEGKSTRVSLDCTLLATSRVAVTAGFQGEIRDFCLTFVELKRVLCRCLFALPCVMSRCGVETDPLPQLGELGRSWTKE